MLSWHRGQLVLHANAACTPCLVVTTRDTCSLAQGAVLVPFCLVFDLGSLLFTLAEARGVLLAVSKSSLAWSSAHPA